MSCVDDLPNIGLDDMNYTCATEIASMGPVAALLTILIGIPLVKLVLRYIKKLFDTYDYTYSNMCYTAYLNISYNASYTICIYIYTRSNICVNKKYIQRCISQHKKYNTCICIE